MEEFQRVDVVRHFDQRHVEAQCVVDYLFQRVGRNIFAKEGVGHAVGYFLKAELFDVFIEFLRQGLYFTWHEQAPV